MARGNVSVLVGGVVVVVVVGSLVDGHQRRLGLFIRQRGGTFPRQTKRRRLWRGRGVVVSALLVVVVRSTRGGQVLFGLAHGSRLASLVYRGWARV